MTGRTCSLTTKSTAELPMLILEAVCSYISLISVSAVPWPIYCKREVQLMRHRIESSCSAFYAVVLGRSALTACLMTKQKRFQENVLYIQTIIR